MPGHTAFIVNLGVGDSDRVYDEKKYCYSAVRKVEAYSHSNDVIGWKENSMQSIYICI